MTVAYQREAIRLVESLGLEILDQWLNKGHLHMVLKGKDGTEGRFTFHTEWMGANRQNQEADLKRFARAHSPAAMSETALAAALRKASPEFKQVKISKPPASAAVSQPSTKDTITMSDVKVKPPKSINKLRAPEVFKLTKWVEGLEEGKLSQTYAAIAKQASVDLSFEVSPSSIATALEACGRKTTRQSGPGSNTAARFAELEKRISTLEDMVLKLMVK